MIGLTSKHKRNIGVCAGALLLAGACGGTGDVERTDASMDSAMTDASAGADASASDAAGRDAAGGDASGTDGTADSAVTSDGAVDAAGSDANQAKDGGQDSGPDISGLKPGGDFAATRVTGAYLPGTADEIRPVSGFAYFDPLDITKVDVLKVLLTDFPVTTCRVDLISTWRDESIGKHLLLCTIDPTRVGGPQPGFRLDGASFGWYTTKSWDCYINLQDGGEVSGRVTGDFRYGTADEAAFTFDVVYCGEFDSRVF